MQNCLQFLGIATCWCIVCFSTISSANEFVGILAMALEDEVAKQIGISETTVQKLQDLVDDREDAAIELAYELRDLPAAEQASKLAPFRRKSEQMGLALLTGPQRNALEAVRLSRTGLEAVLEPKVAAELNLNAKQQAAMKEILQSRELAIRELDRRSAAREKKQYELQLGAVLQESQRAKWGTLTTPSTVEDPPPQMRPTKKMTQSASESEKGGELRFSFRYAPWSEVIEWFATQADLSLVMDAPPQGTLNYTDPRGYSPAQAIDLLNSVLLTKGYTLVRRDRMLMVVNLEDGIPPNLITEVPVESLDERGAYELVRCLFTMSNANAADVEEEIGRLLGPQGNVVLLDASNQLVITETAGRLRTFRTIIEAAERKNSSALGEASLIQLEHIRAKDVTSAWRKLMGLSEEDNALADGSLRIAPGKTSRSLIASGQPNRVREFQELVNLLDVAGGDGRGIDVAQLEVYPVTEADPTSVLEVVQTLLVDDDDVRLASDPKSGNLVALARPDQHRTIRATLQQMQQDRREVEVVRLRLVDPQLAMMSIEKLFDIGQEGEEGSSNGPRVDADPVSRSLLIRGSKSQIEEIRALLKKMGETETPANDRSLTGGRGNLRMIPIDAATAKRAMEQMQSIWPTVRQNPIRVVTPSDKIRARGRRKPNDASDAPGDQTRQGRRSHYVVAQQAETLGESQKTYPAVVVTVGDQGLLIASEDTAALDDFEQVFRTLSDRLFVGTKEMAVFYLKYAKVEVASELIKQFMGGGATSSSGGGSLIGQLAGAALGGGQGGLIGSLLGGGGGGEGSAIRTSGGAAIIADPRLNALVVQATPKDLDFIEKMLEVLDTPGSPEQIETIPRPRTILINNTDAEAVAQIVRSVYASRLTGQGSAPRQPSPEEFIRAMSGQKNSGRAIKDAVSEQTRMTVSVDTRRNALIVVAPESLFQEVELLVQQLDFATPELQETIRYGQSSGSSPEIIRSALASIMGEESQPSRKQESSAPAMKRNPAGQRGETAPAPEQLKRRMEFFKAIQKANAAQSKKNAAAGKREKK